MLMSLGFTYSEHSHHDADHVAPGKFSSAAELKIQMRRFTNLDALLYGSSKPPIAKFEIHRHADTYS